MKVEQLHIKGFRNFEDETIHFEDKTLIIGANDVGKTNLLYCLRILFDKTISEYDLDLSDSDYNVRTNSNSIEITATITDVHEECLISEFTGHLKDGQVLIRFTKTKDTNYDILVGFNEDTLVPIHTRRYLKRLNMEYIQTQRNLFKLMQKERQKLLEYSKTKLKIEDDESYQSDNHKIVELQEDLDLINNTINSLNYITTALDEINCVLKNISIQNEGQKLKFIAGQSDVQRLLNDVNVADTVESDKISLGGDGKCNQIYIATWFAKYKLLSEVNDHITFIAIEEPEAHLHPHQQRKFSSYIQNCDFEQLFLTTHSPQIAAHFPTSNVVRLYMEHRISHAACGGCSQALNQVFKEFGYRLNQISAETFFASGAFLVEGMSEVLFYHALSKEIGIDLDRYNISIISVEGIGFKPYIAILEALKIPWVLRTDNDISTKGQTNPKHKFYSGVSRICGIAQLFNIAKELQDYYSCNSLNNEWNCGEEPNSSKSFNDSIKKIAKNYSLYLSDVDLETDLANSDLKPILMEFYEKNTVEELIKRMKTKKAENMLDFLAQKASSLRSLRDSSLALPLLRLQNLIVENYRHVN